MEIRLLDVAQQELDDAVAYYNGEVPGLGDQFLLEALSALDRIKEFPLASIHTEYPPLPDAKIPLRDCL